MLHMGDVVSQHPDHRRLAATASAQFGYFTATQAQAAGFSRDLLTHHTRSGRFLRIRRGLYRLRDYPTSPYGDVMAAWLAVGSDAAVISHETALGLHELSDATPDAIHLSVSRSKRHLPKLPGVVIHTTSRTLHPEDTVMIDSMRVTSPARTILDMADAGTLPSIVGRAVAQALDRGLMTAEELTQRSAERGQRVKELVARAVGTQTEMAVGDRRDEASSLGGRRGRSGYRYQDFVAAQWYARLLHPETTEVRSVQNEARGTIDDIRVTFSAGARRFLQVKERLRSQDKQEILNDLLAHYRNEPGDELELVTRDAWDSLRQLAEYARQDSGNYAAFVDTVQRHTNRWVRQEWDRVAALCGDERQAHAFLRQVTVKDRQPDKETIEQDTTAQYLERITDPTAGAFTLLVARAYEVGEAGTPQTEDDVRIYLEGKGGRVISARSPERLFLTLLEFRRRVEGDVPLGHGGRFVGRDIVIEDVLAKLAAGESVVAIQGGGGLGKTRSLLELGERIPVIADLADRAVLYIHPDVEATDAALRELDPMQRYIVFIDDAHENSAVLRLLRRLLSDPNLTAGTQIVVALRPHFATRLTEALAAASRKVAVVHLESIQGEELDAAIQQAPYSMRDERTRSQVLRLAEGEPLLAQFAVLAVQNGSDLSRLSRDELVAQYLDSRIGQLEQAGHQMVRRYLAVLAALRSVEFDDQALREQVRQVTGVDSMAEGQILSALEQAHLLRRNVLRVRVKPDTIRDYVLVRSFFDENHPYSFTDDVLLPFLRWKISEILLSAAEAEALTEHAEARRALDDFLGAVRSLLPGADNLVRYNVLQKLRRVAYFRPEDVVLVVRSILDGPEGADSEVEVEGLDRMVTITHATVLEETVNLLEESSYGALVPTLDTLFALATYRPDEDDFARARERAVSLLGRICTFDPFGKPYEVQAVCSERMERWARMPGGRQVVLALLPRLFTPWFESTRLAPGSHSQVVVTWGVLPAHPVLTAVYERALRLGHQLYASAASPSEQRAVVEVFTGYTDKLNSLAISGAPVAERDQAMVQQMCRAIIAVLTGIMERPETSLPIMEMVYEWAHQVVRLQLLPREDLGILLDLPERILLFQTFVHLVGNPIRYTRRRKIEEVRAEQEQWLQGTAASITRDSIEGWLDIGERIVRECREAGRDMSFERIEHLFRLVAERSPQLGWHVVDEATGSALAPVIPAVLAGLLARDPDRFRVQVDAWLDHGDLDRHRLVAAVLARTDLQVGGLELVLRLVQAADTVVDLHLLRCLPRLGERHPDEAVSVLREIARRGDEGVLNEVAQVLPNPSTRQDAGVLSLRTVPPQAYLEIFSTFVRLSRFDDYVVWCLEEVSSLSPTFVVDFFEARIAEGTRWVEAVPALPGASPLTALRGAPGYANLLRRVRDWTLRTEGNFAYHAPRLFALLSGGIDDTSMEVLNEWLETGDIKRIRRVAWLIRECNGNARYMKLARLIIMAARGDEETEELVCSGIQYQDGATFGTMTQRVEGRIASLADWQVDDDPYVKGFARRAAATMREMAERVDASLGERLEET